MKKTLVVLMLIEAFAVNLVFGMPATAPEQWPSFAAVAVPISGPGGLSWGDLTAIVALLSAVVGGVQWLIMKAMIEPTINSMKDWAEKKFPTVESFHAHETADMLFQSRTSDDLKWVRDRITNGD